jgi:hypothetical protein
VAEIFGAFTSLSETMNSFRDSTVKAILFTNLSMTVAVTFIGPGLQKYSPVILF